MRQLPFHLKIVKQPFTNQPHVRMRSYNLNYKKIVVAYLCIRKYLHFSNQNNNRYKNKSRAIKPTLK